MNNLHISYDLFAPGKNYDAVIAKIQSLGEWAKIHKSFWYVKSTLSAAQARDAVWAVMDFNDSVYVVDSTNNEAAWINLHKDVGPYIKDRWFKQYQFAS